MNTEVMRRTQQHVQIPYALNQANRQAKFIQTQTGTYDGDGNFFDQTAHLNFGETEQTLIHSGVNAMPSELMEF